MTLPDLLQIVIAHGGEWSYACAEAIYADLPRERLRLLATPDTLAFGFAEAFDRWANSRDVVCDLPRDAEQFAAMVAYVAAHRDLRKEHRVTYRDARQWARKA